VLLMPLFCLEKSEEGNRLAQNFYLFFFLSPICVVPVSLLLLLLLLLLPQLKPAMPSVFVTGGIGYIGERRFGWQNAGAERERRER